MTREVARNYGVLLADEGHTLRGTFIVDPNGVLRYMVVHDNNVTPTRRDPARAAAAADRRAVSGRLADRREQDATGLTRHLAVEEGLVATAM